MERPATRRQDRITAVRHPGANLSHGRGVSGVRPRRSLRPRPLGQTPATSPVEQTLCLSRRQVTSPGEATASPANQSRFSCVCQPRGAGREPVQRIRSCRQPGRCTGEIRGRPAMTQGHRRQPAPRGADPNGECRNGWTCIEQQEKVDGQAGGLPHARGLRRRDFPGYQAVFDLQMIFQQLFDRTSHLEIVVPRE